MGAFRLEYFPTLRSIRRTKLTLIRHNINDSDNIFLEIIFPTFFV